MKPLRLGALEVLRIEEMLWPVPLTFLFPQLSLADVAPHAAWLQPRFFSPDWQMVLSLHAFLVRTPHHTVLVDTCVGNDKERAYPEWNRMHTDFLGRLRAAGVAPEEVDFVFCTHFHGDHVGWNTRLDNGRWVPTFPNARYLFHRAEYEYWERVEMPGGSGNTRRDAFEDSVLPVVTAGQAVLVDGDHAIDDQIHLASRRGHISCHHTSPAALEVIGGNRLGEATQSGTIGRKRTHRATMDDALSGFKCPGRRAARWAAGCRRPGRCRTASPLC